MSKEYIIVHRIDKTTPLDKHIPLHMTLIHWFEFDGGDEKLIEALRNAVGGRSPISTHATKKALFGIIPVIPVMRLERTKELLDLHLALEAMARSLNAMLEERWIGEKNWNPHVTHQPEGRLQSGNEVNITDLDLITKRSDGMREFVARVYLPEGNH